jgi:hypothetical protein
MPAAVMDTHRIVKRLKEAGFSDAQAETVTDVLRESREADFAQFATKADLAAAVAELRAEIQALRGELRAEIQAVRTEVQAVKADLIKWLVPLLLGQAALIAALVKLL